jgi:4'-phosphopantetheinyl transferase EntD
VIERLVPAHVAVGETWGDLEEALFAEELETIRRARDKRRAEFRSVRACARIALSRLGLDRTPLVPGPAGAPSWPPGIVGSMTHCDGYRAAAVAWATDVHGIGIDAEPHAPLPAGVLDTVSSPVERDQIVRLRSLRSEVCWDRVLFSAKESVYKTWYPLVGTWLGFEDVHLTLHSAVGTFTVDLVGAGLEVAGRPVRQLDGRWLVDRDFVVTAIVCI